MSKLYIDGRSHQPFLAREDAWYYSCANVRCSYDSIETITSFPYGLPREDIDVKKMVDNVDMGISMRHSLILHWKIL